MPQIKQYTRQVMPNELIKNQASAGSFGGETAGLQAMAQGASNMAGALGEASDVALEIKLKQDARSYNEMMSDAQLKIIEAEGQLQSQEFEDDAKISEAYAQQVKDIMGTYSFPRSMRDKLQQDLSNMQTRALQVGVGEQSRRAGVKAKTAFENTLTNATNMIRIDPSRFADAESLVLSQIELMPNMAGVDKAALTDEAVDGLRGSYANTMSQKDPYGFIRDVKAGKYNDVEGLDRYVGAAELSIERAVKAQEKAQSEGKSLIESRLDLALAQSGSAQDLNSLSLQIDKLQNRYGEEWANDYRVKLVKANKSFDNNTNDILEGSLFASGDKTLNPRNNDHKKQFESFYNSVLQNSQFQELDELTQESVVTDIVTKAKFIPDTLKGEIESAAKSFNQEDVAKAARIYNNIRTKNPYLVDYLANEKDLERIRMISSRVNANMPFKEAKKLIDDRLDPINAPSEEIIRDELSKLKVDYNQKLQESFRTWGDWLGESTSWVNFGLLGNGLDTENPAALQQLDFAKAEYRTFFEDAYRRVRNEDDAHMIASEKMKQFNRSSVNPTPMIMKHAPEKFYAIENQDSSWIREQAINDALNYLTGSDVGGAFYNPKYTKEYLSENLYIVPHPRRTAETVKTMQPEYSLVLIDEGEPINILGENKFFKPDEATQRKLLLKPKSPDNFGSASLHAGLIKEFKFEQARGNLEKANEIKTRLKKLNVDVSKIE